jgi:Arc/MetJ family transcription regulator
MNGISSERVKTTIDVDRALAQEAAAVLGTATLKDTVNAALREVVATEHRRRLSARIRAGEVSAPTPSELERLRAPRVPVGSLDVLRRAG